MHSENSIPLQTKRCSSCRQVLPASAFTINRTHPSGLQSYCTPCRTTRQRAKREGIKKPCPDCGRMIHEASTRCHRCAQYLHRANAYAEFENPNPSGKCMCGCGVDTPISDKTRLGEGTIRGYPSKYLKGHGHSKADPLTGNYTIEDRGYYEGPCWIWNGKTGHGGYGQLSHYKKRWVAHRLMYTREVGPIPDGLYLDHLCNQPACCKPTHLSPCTQQENVRRAYLRTLTVAEIADIRALCTESADDAEVLYRFQMLHL